MRLLAFLQILPPSDHIPSISPPLLFPLLSMFLHTVPPSSLPSWRCSLCIFFTPVSPPSKTPLPSVLLPHPSSIPSSFQVNSIWVNNKLMIGECDVAKDQGHWARDESVLIAGELAL